MKRQIILDTETTGLEPKDGHKLIEVGAVEMIDRRLTGNNLHIYLNPSREIDRGAIEVHGITNEFLADKPKFATVADEIMQYIQGAELIIHNASFDLGFLNHELKMVRGNKWGKIEDHCQVIDSLAMARKMHPGARNSLDALCKRYGIINSHRKLHGALLDSEILAEVYLTMTGGQINLTLQNKQILPENAIHSESLMPELAHRDQPLKIISATAEENAAHLEYLTMLQTSSGEKVAW